MFDSSSVIIGLLAILCGLAALDLWRQSAIRNEDSWYKNYVTAVKHSDEFWKIGFRLEDLDIKTDFQLSYWQTIKHQIDTALSPKFKLDRNALRQNTNNIAYTRQSRIALHNLLQNDSSVYQIRCGTDGALLRIGVNDFRTDNRDVCQIFTANKVDPRGPHTMFDLEPSEDGSFSLRSVANGRFIKTVPPPSDNPLAPWKLVIGGTLVGSAEKFRFTEDGKLFSALMGGFFNCGGNGQMVSGNPGEYSQYNSKAFIMEKVNSDTVRNSYLLIDLSNKIINIQTENSIKYSQTIKQRYNNALEVTGMDNPNIIKICLGIPITSKGTDMKNIQESPFWTNIFDSFMKSIDWRSNRYIYRFYLGFDKADQLYDTGDAWSELREEFRYRATYRMQEQLIEESIINTILTEQLSLKLMHFDHLEGAPSQIVSQLMLSAYTDGFDYFYQVNDDTVIVTPNWAPKLISALASNPKIPNFGVTGPSDSNNEKIFTHSFVHRTHIEVFGHLFPPFFKNWWSDDWISTVYGTEHTVRCDDVLIKHNVNAQKTNGLTRYTVDQSAQVELDKELRKGHVQIDVWLKQKKLPRLPLPVVCGYIPLVTYLGKGLEAPHTADSPPL